MISILYGIRYEIMLYLNKSSKSTYIREISKGVERTYPITCQRVRELEEKGLIYSQNNPNDKKKKMVGLTPTGLEVVKILHKLKPLLSLGYSTGNLSY